MDQPSGQAQPPRPQQNTGHRDIMFCHQCRDEWYRDEHGLTCPECGSDFTEIIEEGHDPREELGHGHEDSDDDDPMPDLVDMPGHLHLHDHQNPWRGDHDDPDEGDISNIQFRQLGPGRFTVTGTVYRSISPTGRPGNGGSGGNNGPGPIGGFAGMLSSILGAARPTQPPNQSGQDSQPPPRQGTPGSGQGTTPGGHRFTYTAGARLYPRDANQPGPHMEPVDELNNVLVGLLASFGEPPGQQREHFPGIGPDYDPTMHHMNPLMHLFTQMMTGGHGQVGDAVYSQEALDRIITQLMEHNASSNAPGPASQNDIDSLPRKQITVEDLGSEGRAECSICMEEVNIGEEVAELPCHHWFHHPCIAAWLGEHDTCPHCRKGITKHSDNPENPSQNQNASSSAPAPQRQMPGSFGAPDADASHVRPSQNP